jgi:tungstate transport system substrate-binding protein
VADGFGVKRLDVMYNDFVLAGPKNDPAGIRGLDVEAAFKKIAAAGAAFVSRGDDSGTHKKELRLWKTAGLAPAGRWYLESGSGMEATLRIANEKTAYCLVDRATWLAHQKEIDALAILVEGDAQLFNPYSVIVVAPGKFPWLNVKLATYFAEFIRSPEGQAIIRDFGKEKFGSALFFPDVLPPQGTPGGR